MLVLTRKVGESIIIGDNIKIQLVSVSNNKVRLGIDAPREAKVHREEVYEAIKAQNEKSARDSVEDLRSISEMLNTNASI